MDSSRTGEYRTAQQFGQARRKAPACPYNKITGIRIQG
jgi:hypothetical protein